MAELHVPEPPVNDDQVPDWIQFEEIRTPGLDPTGMFIFVVGLAAAVGALWLLLPA